MAQLMPLPLTVSCFSKIQIGFTFLVPAHPGSPGKKAVIWVYLCMYVPTTIARMVIKNHESVVLFALHFLNCLFGLDFLQVHRS